ncbi:NACHT domain-containing protein [Actinoallomurus iriomotensis]|uniref:AAA+ ATPase domain-containing protein n=1 Tax=Actinoallomurus iriomotensis TaxID=478107 RepID=A0A9W6VU42_9ACTN|nr:ATP-binding protein [Actinoallomurus iriomotensis]GLY79177.1 hypothetical protein Airi01_074440 [Actinoallomurus iriomotensis]
MTYQGALQILGCYERSLVDRLDRLLGGVILGAGAVAGAAALGGPAAAPLAGLQALWGWVDQKSEAVSLLRRVLDGVSGRLAGTTGSDRIRLVGAAHTTIVVVSFFEALRDRIGTERFGALELTDEEQRYLATGELRETHQSAVEFLYTADVRAPSATCGFVENQRWVRDWMAGVAERVKRFLTGLAAWEHSPASLDGIEDIALAKYRSFYIQLAATVPEFRVWAALAEHAATRSEIRDVTADVLAVLEDQGVALSRVERLLSLVAGVPRPEPDLCAVLHRVNRGALDEHIVSEDAVRAEEGLAFPTLGEAFINPRCRPPASAGEAASRMEGDKWDHQRPRVEGNNIWEHQRRLQEVDLVLAAHLTTPEATRVPMLILGHPGAGKSLLTKVLAARLPPAAYTVVRVPLRRVGAEAPVYEQIQQALDQATHRRVDWGRLTEQGRATIRVVLLDGLDELLQAAGSRGGYLQEVAEFQRREADQDLPVVVVVTSRTVVADRVTVPDGTTVVRLEGFTTEQISAWLSTWNRVNAPAIEAGTVRGLSPQTALIHPELACQPLLLLMLALYAADPAAPALDTGLSQADLYRRLLTTFTRREVARTQPPLSEDELHEAIHEQMWQLSVSAFAMFNRGRQDVTDADLGADLAALDDTLSPRSIELGRRLIGRFFFIHTAEANSTGETHRCYEFMHATFAEYLLAHGVIDVLADTAQAAFAARRGLPDPNDDLLFALLSHQSLAVRRTALDFMKELVDELDDQRAAQLRQTLELLITDCRHRHGSDRYAAYRPVPLDRVRELAAYSANLIVLRTLAGPSPGSVSLAHLWPDQPGPGAVWRSTTALWKAGLDPVGWESMLATLKLTSTPTDATHPSVALTSNDIVISVDPDIKNAMLVGDTETVARLRWGAALRDSADFRGRNWTEDALTTLVPLLVLPDRTRGPDAMSYPDPGRRDSAEEADVLWTVAMILKLYSPSLSAAQAHLLVGWMLNFPTPHPPFDGYALAAAVAAHPSLLNRFPQLNDPATYRQASGAWVLLGDEPQPEPHLQRLQRLRELLKPPPDTDPFPHFRQVLHAYQQTRGSS